MLNLAPGADKLAATDRQKQADVSQVNMQVNMQLRHTHLIFLKACHKRISCHLPFLPDLVDPLFRELKRPFLCRRSSQPDLKLLHSFSDFFYGRDGSAIKA